MKYKYYPGCTLKTKAKELDAKGRAAAGALGFSLEEIDNWQCCGGAYTSSKTEAATKLSAVRALHAAEKDGGVVVTMCSACHNVLKQTDYDMKNDVEFADKIRRYMGSEECYSGGAQVLHYLEVLRDRVGFDAVRAAVKKPLEGMKIAPYYGCLLLRPAGVMAMDNPENPSIMEDFIRSLGAEAVVYPQRNECCGGYVVIEDKEQAKSRSSAVVSSAKNCGADMIITACPLCLYNLKKVSDIPVVYFTELLADALDVGTDKAE